VFQIIFSQSVIAYKEMIETFKLKEFEKECILKLPEGSAIFMRLSKYFLVFELYFGRLIRLINLD